MNDSLLIAGLIFVLVMLAGLLAFYYSSVYRKRTALRKRIRNEVTHGFDDQYSEGVRKNGVLQRALSRCGEALRPKKESEVSQLRKRFLRAGYRGESGPAVFFGAKACLALLLVFLSLLFKFTILKALPYQQLPLLMIVSAIAGFYLPDLYLYQKTQDRKRKIFEGFPDALDLMVVCVEAGMGLDGAIKRVGDEMALKSCDLSDEFRMLSIELRAGKPRVDALRNLAMRTDLEDVSSLVTLLIQTDKFGTKVAQALRVHSDAMRTKRYQRAEEVAARLPVKIVFPLIFFIFPALFITILGPAMIRLYRDFFSH